MNLLRLVAEEPMTKAVLRAFLIGLATTAATKVIEHCYKKVEDRK